MTGDDMRTLAEMLKETVRDELTTMSATGVDIDTKTRKRGAGRNLEPQNAWMEAMIAKGQLDRPGGKNSHYFKLFMMVDDAYQTRGKNLEFILKMFAGNLKYTESRTKLDELTEGELEFITDTVANAYNRYTSSHWNACKRLGID